MGWLGGRSSKAWPFSTWSWEVNECCYVVSLSFFFFFQFNYMHECFERVFCELKWRKEVILNNLQLIFFIFVCFKCIGRWPMTWDPHLHLCLSGTVSSAGYPMWARVLFQRELAFGCWADRKKPCFFPCLEDVLWLQALPSLMTSWTLLRLFLSNHPPCCCCFWPRRAAVLGF